LVLQCIDAVGWAAGRPSQGSHWPGKPGKPGKLGSRKAMIWRVKELLAWLSVWSKVQTICIWSCWCYCHPFISCFF